MHEKMVRHSTVSARSAHAAIQRARLPILTTAVPLVAMQVDDLSTISLSSTFSFFLFKAKKRISVITSSGIVFYCLKKNCFFLPIHSGHQVRWTYQPGSHRRKVKEDFSSTFFMRCVP